MSRDYPVDFNCDETLRGDGSFSDGSDTDSVDGDVIKFGNDTPQLNRH